MAGNYPAQYMPHVAMQLCRNFQALHLPDFVISATYPMFAIARKYPLLFYQSCATSLLTRLYDLLLTPTHWSSKLQIAERIMTYFEIQSQIMGNFSNEVTRFSLSFTPSLFMWLLVNCAVVFHDLVDGDCPQ